MFKISVSDSYSWPVTVLLPGESVPNEFDIEFRRLSQAELTVLMSEINSQALNDDEVCRRIVCGWAKVRNEDGEAIEFTDERFEQLLNIYPVPKCIVKAFDESLKGAKRKNSPTPPATGR